MKALLKKIITMLGIMLAIIIGGAIILSIIDAVLGVIKGVSILAIAIFIVLIIAVMKKF